jgi:uncharacterized membrane protein
MYTRPKLSVERTDGDNLLESLGWLALLLLWGVALYGYLTLPAVIPVHFNGAGQADGRGPKAMIFLLPLAGTLLFSGLTALNKRPDLYNYPAPLTPDNTRRFYTLGTRLMRSLKVSIMSIFLMTAIFTQATAIGTSDGLPWWFFPLTMALLIVPAAHYTYQMFRTK